MSAELATARGRRRAEAAALAHAFGPLALDLSATLVFYLLFAVTGNLLAATLAGLGLGVAQLAWMRWRRQPIAPLQWAMLLLVGTVGGAALWLHDPRVILYKGSFLYVVVGASMLKPGWMMRYVPPIARAHLPARPVVRAGFAWAALIIGTGIFLFVLTLTQPAQLVAAVMGVWAPVSKLALSVGQYLYFRGVVRRRLRAAG